MAEEERREEGAAEGEGLREAEVIVLDAPDRQSFSFVKGQREIDSAPLF